MGFPDLSLFINLARDLIFVIFYIEAIESNRSGSLQRKILAVCFLIASNYFIMFIDHVFYELAFDTNRAELDHAMISVIRNILTYISFFTYIVILKKIPIKVTAYDALLTSMIYVVCHNAFLTPITKPILDIAVTIVEDPMLNRLICLFLLNCFSILVYILAYKFISLKNIESVDRFRFTLVLIFYIVSVFFSSSIKFFEFVGEEYAYLLSAYIIISQFLLLVCIAYFEHYQHAVRIQQRIELENQVAYSLLASIDKQNRNDTLIRHMRHDLKNHLTSIRFLLTNQEEEKAIQYIDEISEDCMVSDPRIKTGNLIIDGILAQKLETAGENQINLSISADFSYLDTLEKADLCVIFGNLLDNALEACMNVSEGPRFINIRGQHMGDTMLYSIENSFNGIVRFIAGMPVTTKTNKSIHGIGLNSVKSVIEKYSATIAFSSKGQIFSVICSFPLSIAPEDEK